MNSILTIAENTRRGGVRSTQLLLVQTSRNIILQIVKKAQLGISGTFSMLLLVEFLIYAEKYSLVIFIPTLG